MDDDAGPIYRLALAARPMPTKRSTSKATQLTVSREDDGATRPSESLCFATKLSPFFFRVTNVHGRPNHHPEISHFITQPTLT